MPGSPWPGLSASWPQITHAGVNQQDEAELVMVEMPVDRVVHVCTDRESRKVVPKGRTRPHVVFRELATRPGKVHSALNPLTRCEESTILPHASSRGATGVASDAWRSRPGSRGKRMGSSDQGLGYVHRSLGGAEQCRTPCCRVHGPGNKGRQCFLVL